MGTSNAATTSPAMPRRLASLALACAATLGLALGGTGCGAGSGAGMSMLGGGGTPTIESSVGGGVFRASPRLRVYRLTSAVSASMYLTDMPPEAFAAGADPLAFPGAIIHVHVMMTPKAGETPIASTACNTAVRTLILSAGEVGIYGGGGFALADADELGEGEFSATVRGGTMRLTHATPQFVDRLVQARFTGTASATLDEPLADAIAARMAWLTALTTPLDEVGYAPELDFVEAQSAAAREPKTREPASPAPAN